MNLYELADRLGPGHQDLWTVAEAIRGDALALLAARDLAEEHGMLDSPYKVGQKYLINTVTLYYVGEVAEMGFAWLVLKNASWVHWTGRLSQLLKHCDFRHPSLRGRKPRTEYVGTVIIDTPARVSGYPWPGELPVESIE